MTPTKLKLAEQAMILAEKHDLDELEIPGVVRLRRRPTKLAPTAAAPSREAEERQKETARKAAREERVKADLERFEGGGL